MRIASMDAEHRALVIGANKELDGIVVDHSAYMLADDTNSTPIWYEFMVRVNGVALLDSLLCIPANIVATPQSFADIVMAWLHSGAAECAIAAARRARDMRKYEDYVFAAKRFEKECERQLTALRDCL